MRPAARWAERRRRRELNESTETSGISGSVMPRRLRLRVHGCCDSSLGPRRRRVSAANLEGEDSALALRSPKHRANFIRTVRRALLPFNAKVLASFGGKSNKPLQCASMACRRGSCPFAVLVERSRLVLLPLYSVGADTGSAPTCHPEWSEAESKDLVTGRGQILRLRSLRSLRSG